MRTCFSLKTPLISGNSSKEDNQKLSPTEKGESSTTIPKGSRHKCAEVGSTIRTKKCRLCGVEKPISEFYFRKDSGHYRSECKECLRQLSTFRSTGWTPEDYEKAYIAQNGKCAICGCKLDSSRYTRFAGDHDHKTGKLRGLLCTNCNTALGLMKDSPLRLQSAIDYLKRHSTDSKDIV